MQSHATPQDTPSATAYTDGPLSGPQSVPASGMSVISEASSSTLAMNNLMSGVCFRPDEEDLLPQYEYYTLGDSVISRQAAYEVFQGYVQPTHGAHPRAAPLLT